MSAQVDPQRLQGRRWSKLPDRLFSGGTAVVAIIVVALLVAILAMLAASSAETWQTFGLSFITGTTWDPVASVYGALPYIAGTIFSSAIALVLAAPIGLLTAIFLAEYAPRRISVPLTFVIELLAAIPSVVIGLWGVFVLGPFLKVTVESFMVDNFGWIPIFKGPAFGIGLFAAGVILAIMILPTIVTISREILVAVPGSQREAMYGLGATRWEVISRVVIPLARSGIIGAVILGLGRALGETLAVTMVIGNGQNIPTSLFDQGQTLASKIATSFNEAQVGLQTSSLIALGLILLAITIAINIVARAFVGRATTRVGGG
ncbi:MAG: phosphate ABC transporter permease subunit PstC [Chloroflexota bacterium]